MINICLNTSPTTSSVQHQLHSGHIFVHRKMSQVVMCNHMQQVPRLPFHGVPSHAALVPLTESHSGENSAKSLQGGEKSNLALAIYRYRAPVASLDCMDDFSTNTQHLLDNTLHFGSSYVVNHLTMNSSLTPAGLRYKNLGKSGLRVSNIGLGTWGIFAPSVPDNVAEDIVNLALDSGINVFDLSEAHSGTKAEIELGNILRKRNHKRSSVVIVTKIYWGTKCEEKGLSRKNIVESVRASLKRLQTDYIDIVLLHKLDHMCPMEEIVRAMNHVINVGWVMYWGTARWAAAEIMEAYTNCRQFNCFTPIVEQSEYHMFCRDKTELYMPEIYNKIGVDIQKVSTTIQRAYRHVRYCCNRKKCYNTLGLMVWSALTTGKGLSREDLNCIFARSRFNRKYSSFSWAEEETSGDSTATRERTLPDETRRHCDKLRDIADLAASLNCTVSQLAVAWCLKNETVHCLLLGAVTTEQLYELIHALQILPQLSAGVMSDIDKILENKPLRPPIVSTLLMRGQASSTARLESPKDGNAEPSEGRRESEAEVGEASRGADTSSVKEEKSNAFCELQ